MLPTGNSPRRRLWPRRITRACQAVGVIAIAIAAGLIGPGLPAQAQTPAGDASPSAQAMTAPLVDGSHALQAHYWVESWLREGQVPSEVEVSAPVTGLFGLCVTLRTDGITLGTGQAFHPSPRADAPSAAVDLVPLLQQAAQEALAQTLEKLKDAQLRAVVEGRGATPLTPPRIEQLADRIAVDIQIGHRLQTIHVPAEAPPDQVFGTFAPGYHGLRMPAPTGQEAEEAVIWPATALAMNTSPQSQLVQLLDKRGHRPRLDLPLVARPGGITLQRFDVIHVVRPRPSQPAMQLVRGNALLPTHPIDGRTLDEMALRLAKHLEQRFTTSGLVRGTYQPSRNQYDPPVASPEEVALACYAMTRHCKYLLTLRTEDASLQGSARRTLAVATDQARHMLEQNQVEPATAALVLLTLVDTPVPAGAQAMRDRLGQHLLELANRQPLVQDRQEATHALVTAALAAWYAQTRDASLGKVVQQRIDQLWQHAQGSPNVHALPWFMLAHERVAHLLAGSDPALAQTLAQQQQGIATLLTKLSEQQVIEPPVLGPPDVIGGFELHRGPAGSPPNPDWRTAPLTAFLAIALREPGITQGRDVIGWLLTAGMATRFLGQLIIDDPSCYYIQSPADALGGVRLTLWNNELGVAPLAMSLLAVTELQETQTQLASFSGAPAGGL
ncbi:MAG TPA: hypothetical protein VF184_13685 [Phycisphaeraceae bacterium]